MVVEKQLKELLKGENLAHNLANDLAKEDN